jgi:hypothetical protein
VARQRWRNGETGARESISGLTGARAAVWAVLGHGERRRRAGRGAVEDGEALPLYMARGGGGGR